MRVRSITALLVLLVACAKPLPEGAVQTVVARAHPGKRVIFVGLDGADWKLLDPFLTDGTMPHLASIVAHGERRILLSQHPPLSPLVWTSMMTGVSPLEHRILDFTRFHPGSRVQEPITSDERAVPAIWNMARSGGRSVAVFGLWATWPAEPGVVLTDRDLPRDYLAATELTRRRALDWIDRNHPDLTVLYFQGTDEIGHFTSGNIAAARPYFRRIDAILGELEARARRSDAELIIASDHGFDWGGRHEVSSTATATAAKWHRREGIFLRWPRAAATLAPAHVDQICATLLDALGLPRGEGIADAIGESHSGQTVNYRRYFHRSAPARQAAAADGEAIAKLRALGYIGSDQESNGPVAGNSTRTAASYNNEGLVLREAGRDVEAERAFRAALTLAPGYASPRHNLDDLLSARGLQRLKSGDCRGALQDLREVRQESALLWASIAAAEGCLGDDVAAEHAVRRSLALDPNQPELRAMLDHE